MELPAILKDYFAQEKSAKGKRKRREFEHVSAPQPDLSKKKLSVNDKWNVISQVKFFLGLHNLSSQCRKLPTPILKDVAEEFRISDNTVRRVWNEFIVKGESCDGKSSPDMTPKIDRQRTSIEIDKRYYRLNRN